LGAREKRVGLESKASALGAFAKAEAFGLQNDYLFCLHQFSTYFVVDVGKNGCGCFQVVGGFF
jgi:hypothetical protein